MKNPLKMLMSDSVESLQKESQGAMSMFEKTINSLFIINEKIDKAKHKRFAVVSKLESKAQVKRVEISLLEMSKEKNLKLSYKLANFIEG